MADCFISYSSVDRAFAERIETELVQHGVSTFMAAASLKPGDKWADIVLANLRAARWIVVLVSQASATSGYVNQEIGGALIASKRLIPVVWDLPPTHLPGWLRNYQALDLSSSTVAQLEEQIADLATRIRQEKAVGYVILGALVAGVLWANQAQ